METQLSELNQKAEYLYTELETSHDLVAEQNVRIKQSNSKIQIFDRELSRMSVMLAEQEFRMDEFQELVLSKEVLGEVVIRLVEDIRRLTLTRAFRGTRKIKLLLHKTFFRKSNWYLRKINVLPMTIEGKEYLDEVTKSKLRLSQYLEINPDIAMSAINPYTHFILHGKAEGRNIQKRID